MLEFCFWFQLLRLLHHWHDILHLPTKFRPNRIIRDGVMTSYPFFKVAAMASQFYFRFWLLWLHSPGKVEIYPRTKFRRDISIHGWDITISSVSKQMSAVLEFFFQFRFLRLCHHQHVILHLPTKFHQNRTICNRVMTSYPFIKMAAISHIELPQGYCRPPTKCKWGLRCVIKFRLDQISSFADIAIFC